METPFNNGQPAPLPSSLWAATTANGPQTEPFHGERVADVVIVGAGFMGLAAALALAEAGVDVVVLEAAETGWGASGRNNGLLAAGMKRDPHEVVRLLGHEHAERLLRLSGRAPARVAELVDEHAIDCDLRYAGWIQAAQSRLDLPLIARRVHDWQELGADVALIERDAVSSRLGTGYYAGAWYDPRGGSLNPLAYVRGLAMAAMSAGAKIHNRSAAEKIEKHGCRWRVATGNGSISCDVVVACTNAYNDSLPAIRGTVVPLRTAQVASAPLPHTSNVLPGGESASDTQRLLTSFRLTADNRLIMGGASATAGDENTHLFSWLYRAARDRFPQLGDIVWEYGWSGYLALTNDHLPQILEIDDGYYAGIGCNGRGIAMATIMGERIAALINDGAASDCEFPLRRPRRIPGFGLRRAGVAMSVVGSRILDVAERRLGGR